MYIGKVIGTVVATIKIDHLDSRKLLLVNQLDLHGNETDGYDIAVDVVQAGPGDTVLVIDEGNGARQILESGSRRHTGGDRGDRRRGQFAGVADKPLGPRGPCAL